MTKQGIFIAIDGPNGAGKTTIVRLVCEQLRGLGFSVLQTNEPTSRFDRTHEEKHGDALADLIVQDRRDHLLLDIEPALKAGMVVITDRYVASSLVYRKLDDISFEETWQHNQSFRVPDLNILLVAQANTLMERIASKETKSRFEREHGPEEELCLYNQTEVFLRSVGYNVIVIHNDTTITDTTDGIVQSILAIL